MKLFELFVRHAPNRVFVSILLGALSGVLYTLLIPLVLVGINGSEGNLASDDVVVFLGYEIYQYKIAVLFFLLCLVILITRSFSQVILLRVSTDVTTSLREKIYQQISNSPIADLEKTGSARLIAAITTDVARIVFGARALPDLLISCVTIVGMLGFLAYLNMGVFATVMKAIFFGVLTYQIPIFFANRFFQQSRSRVDTLQEAIHGLILGSKELKLSDAKRKKYFEDVLLENEYAVLKADKAANTISRLAVNYGDMISFFVIGIIAYVFVNYHAITKSELTGVIMAMLYITTPIALVVNTIPVVMLAKVSLKKINDLMESIPNEKISKDVCKLPHWNTVRVSNLCYQHVADNDEVGFKVGPIDLELRKGEVTFIVGGNGSGKSTLSKLLTLHYRTQQGGIYFGDSKITDDNINSYRQCICSIYSDYYLFDRLLGEQASNESVLIDEYMSLLGLDNKIEVRDRMFSTTKLSDGQRKRLALLAALIDDKEFYLFDEWAADQDPMFKEAFYRRIIHDLKRRGKAVVVISHDDRYFNEADKIVFMEQGRIRETGREKHVESVGFMPEENLV